MTKLRISLVQSQIIWHNPQANRVLFETQILNCPQDSDLFILPEVFTSGFTMNVHPYAETMSGPTIKKMKFWAETKGAVIMGSLLIEDRGQYFNRLVCVFPDGSTQYYNKRHLFSYSDEDKLVSAGHQRLIIEWKGWKICPLICYDLRFPAWARNNEAYDLLVYVANWPESRSYAWNQLLIARAIENQCYLAAVNRVGEDGRGLLYAGNSTLIDYSGKQIVSLKDDEQVRTISIEKASMNDFRKQFPFLKDQDQIAFKK
jgi:predicted amidohydrolase